MFVDVVIPLPLEGKFTYRCPEHLISGSPIGKRVLVPFGKKVQTGIVFSANAEYEADFDIKNIVCFLDDKPILSACQLELWQWIADYWMCSLGEVMRAALPAALKLESDTRVMLATDEQITASLTAQQVQIVDLLSDGKQHDVQEIARRLGTSSAMPAINRLIRKGIVRTTEQVSEAYKPLYETCVCLNHCGDLNALLDSLQRAPKQQQALLDYLSLTDSAPLPVRRELLPQATAQLVEKGIMRIVKRRVSRLKEREQLTEKHLLSGEQQQALGQIEELFESKATVLLRGVTGSGKTDIYIHLIDKYLAKGNTVLYLVPEIALTTQLTERLEAVFGDRLLVYHSRFSDNERYEIYEQLLDSDNGRLVLGARSAVFLPLPRLGLVIVDEEHDASYKQQEPAPRYHARSVAAMLARLSGAKVLLGSATPSVESYFNASIGKYGLVELLHRYDNIALPEVEVVDLKEQRHRRQMTGHMSDLLAERLRRTLDEGRQAIVFQNRRGYAPYVECKLCGHIPKCINCDISLTYHRHQGILTCHYCGYTIHLPQLCPDCGQPALTDRGIGTEKAEDELAALFPKAQIERMDLDTTRRKTSYQQIIDNFAANRTDILVGTQMLSKGLDFDNVGLVAVLNCDTLLNQPDYRSSERAFEMLEQVSGRSGRKQQRGQVIIQTTNPENEVLKLVVSHDYLKFYEQQIAERRIFRYPPFFRLICVMVSDKNYDVAVHAAQLLQSRLKQIFSHRCSGVIEPVVSRVQNRFQRQIILKFEQKEPIARAKQMLSAEIRQLLETDGFKSVRVYADVDV